MKDFNDPDALDAMRYRFLKQQITFELGSYDGPDELANAATSRWHMTTHAIFDGTNKPPKNVDAAVDAAMLHKVCPKCGRCLYPYGVCTDC